MSALPSSSEVQLHPVFGAPVVATKPSNPQQPEYTPPDHTIQLQEARFVGPSACNRPRTAHSWSSGSGAPEAHAAPAMRPHTSTAVRHLAWRRDAIYYKHKGSTAGSTAKEAVSTCTQLPGSARRAPDVCHRPQLRAMACEEHSAALYSWTG